MDKVLISVDPKAVHYIDELSKDFGIYELKRYANATVEKKAEALGRTFGLPLLRLVSNDLSNKYELLKFGDNKFIIGKWIKSIKTSDGYRKQLAKMEILAETKSWFMIELGFDFESQKVIIYIYQPDDFVRKLDSEEKNKLIERSIHKDSQLKALNMLYGKSCDATEIIHRIEEFKDNLKHISNMTLLRDFFNALNTMKLSSVKPEEAVAIYKVCPLIGKSYNEFDELDYSEKIRIIDKAYRSSYKYKYDESNFARAVFETLLKENLITKVNISGVTYNFRKVHMIDSKTIRFIDCEYTLGGKDLITSLFGNELWGCFMGIY